MNSKKVKPALYTLEKTEWEWCWHWVLLAELAEIVKMYPKEVFETYRDLATLKWVGQGGWEVGPLHWASAAEVCCPNRSSIHSDPIDFEKILVPAGWSEKVILVRRKHDIVRLVREMCWSKMKPSDGTLRKFYVGPKQCTPSGNSMAIIGYDKTNYPAYIGFGNDLPMFKDEK